MYEGTMPPCQLHTLIDIVDPAVDGGGCNAGSGYLGTQSLNPNWEGCMVLPRCETIIVHRLQELHVIVTFIYMLSPIPSVLG